MARIQFKSKPKRMLKAGPIDGPQELDYLYIDVPELTRQHCDMGAFRIHPKYGPYANSDLFPGMLRRIRESTFGTSGRLNLNAVPAGVSVDTSGFLAIVTMDV